MYRAGFQVTSFIHNSVIEEYDDCLHLMDYLSKNGLGSTGLSDRSTVLKDVLLGVAGVYDALYTTKSEETGEDVVGATYELVHFIGWKYHESQQKPSERGSGMSMEEFIDEVAEEGDEESRGRMFYGSITDEDLHDEDENGGEGSG